MTQLKAFGRFWWDFVIGDDWRIAAGLVVAVGVSTLLVHQSIAAWWLLPVAVVALLARSVFRDASAHR
jgi:hypothetical protein